MKSQSSRWVFPPRTKVTWGASPSKPCGATSSAWSRTVPPRASRAAKRSRVTSVWPQIRTLRPPVKPSRSIRSIRPPKARFTPSWTSPSRSIRAPTPAWRNSSWNWSSKTPARIRLSTCVRLRFSKITESIPARSRSWESSSPAGPAPMIATCVRIPSTPWDASETSEN